MISTPVSAPDTSINFTPKFGKGVASIRIGAVADEDPGRVVVCRRNQPLVSGVRR